MCGRQVGRKQLDSKTEMSVRYQVSLVKKLLLQLRFDQAALKCENK